MSLPLALRHAAIAAIAVATVLANLVLSVAWPLSLLAGAAVLLFGELWPHLLSGRRRSALLPAADAEPALPGVYPLSRKEVEVAILVA